MNRRNILFLGLVFLLSISLATGCWDRPFISPDVEGRRLSEELLGYLENDDAEGIKGMLCEMTRESPTIDEEIEAALEFFEGEIISYKKIRISTFAEESVRDGEIVFLYIGPLIKNIETNSGERYIISIEAQLVNANNENKVGIHQIIITDQDDNDFVIGEYLER